MVKTGYVVGMAEEDKTLKKLYQVSTLWSLAAKYMVKYYGERNLALMQQGGATSTIDSISEKAKELFKEHTITIPLPVFANTEYFNKPELTLISPEGEKVISQYLELAVQLKVINWKKYRDSKGMEYEN